jgi:hypothetical protein
MATLERPLKEGNVRTYQEKVALGFPDILASEADADHDTIYAAWNGGVGTANLVDNAVTSAKIAPDQIGPRELADNLPGTILAPGAAVAGIAAVTAPGQDFTSGAEVLLLRVPGYVHRGGHVFLAIDARARNDGSVAAATWELRVYRGATALTTRAVTYDNRTGLQYLPLIWSFVYVDATAAAGTYDWVVNITRTGGTASLTLLGASMTVWTLA